MRVLSIVGNRPQFIKSAALSMALRDAGISEVVVHTGQHYDPELSEVFFAELGLPEPAFRLGLRTSDPALMMPPIRDAIAGERPDWVLVYGDTNSTLAGARAAVDRDIDGSAGTRVPVAHVESGLRSFDMSMPEEVNRIEVDRVAALLFCPDERSAAQLEAEGVTGRREVVGDVMADAARIFGPIARDRSTVLERLGLQRGRYAVATVHRQANVTEDERLRRIVEGLRRVEGPLVFPAHPRTRAALVRLGLDLPTVPPLGYLDFAALTSGARVILTDSGGLQKEAYWCGVPCVTMRPSTEWVDTVAVGANVLVDDDPDAIAAAAAAAQMPDDRPSLYGDGHASERVAAALYAWRP
jgi:UDP-N-acetylglucosamine 2-epimerase